MNDQVTLTAYADQVRELIRNDRNDEAIAICKHILQYYPKYVDAYCLLGEAFLEKGQPHDAKEMFRRVLSADPENVVAYAGLAVALEQDHLVAEAAWHMERAFELAPSNTELRQELHRLYHELDGRPRARLELTSGALARLYVQAGLYSQAVQELNALVAESAARFDARVALAETLWRVGQMRQASEVAQSLLETLPYCLKANLILGTVWKETGSSESDRYLQRAQALDPTNRTAQYLFGAHSRLPLTQARVPRHIEGAPAVQVSVAPELTPVERPLQVPLEPTFEPEQELALFGEPTFKPPVLDTTLPPWLRMPSLEIEEQGVLAQPAEPVADTSAETVPVSPPVAESQPEPAEETTAQVPAWLAQLRQAAEPAAETTTQTPAEPGEDTTSALPPWLRAEAESKETTPTIPSWIEQVQAAEKREAQLAPVAETKSEAAPDLPLGVTETKRAKEAAPASPTETPREEELPPWLGSLVSRAEPEPIVPAAAPTQPQSQASEEKLPPELGQPAAPAETAASVIVAPPTSEPAPVVPIVAPAAPSVGAPKSTRPMRGDSHLVLARAYRDAKQMKEALAEYDYIVQKAPRLVNQVIADLEVLVMRRDVPLEAHRILGDAYTRADRLGEALEEYRFVLEHVSQVAGDK